MLRDLFLAPESKDVAMLVLAKLAFEDKISMWHVSKACARMVRHGVSHIDISSMAFVPGAARLSSRFPNASRVTLGALYEEGVVTMASVLKHIATSDRQFLHKMKRVDVRGFVSDIHAPLEKKKFVISAVKSFLGACCNVHTVVLAITGLPQMTLSSCDGSPLAHMASLGNAVGELILFGGSRDRRFDALMACDMVHKTPPQLRALCMANDICPQLTLRPSIARSLTALSVLGVAHVTDVFFTMRFGDVKLMGPLGDEFLQTVPLLTSLRTLVFHAPRCNTGCRNVMHLPESWSTLGSLRALDIVVDELHGDDNVVCAMSQLRYLRVLNGCVSIASSIDHLTTLTSFTVSSRNAVDTMLPWPTLMACRRLNSVKIVNVQGIPPCGFPTSVKDVSIVYPQHVVGRTCPRLLGALIVLADLRRLHLSRIMMPTVFLTKILGNMSQLEEMDLDFVDFITTRSTPMHPTTMSNLRRMSYCASDETRSLHNTNMLVSHLYMPVLQHMLLRMPITLGTFELLRAGHVPANCECITPLHVKVSNDQYITSSIDNVNLSMREWVGNEDHVLDMKAVTHEAVFTSVSLIGHTITMLDLMPPNATSSDFQRLLADLGDTTLSVIAAKCPFLRRLRIASNGTHGFSSHALAALVHDVADTVDLVELELWTCKGLEDRHVISLVRRHPNLNTLLLTGMERVGAVGYQCLTRLTSLERAGFLGACRLDSDTLKDMPWVQKFVLCEADFWGEDVRIPDRVRVRWLESREAVVCNVFA